jgi:hypothetical protein
MVLKNKYVIGCLVMFYEIEMLSEYIKSIVNMCEGVENPENVTIHFCWNMQEYLESVDLEKISKTQLSKNFSEAIKILIEKKFKVIVEERDNDDPFFNIAQYRRELNHQYCEKVDFVIWGETDSMFPREALHAIETIYEYCKSHGHHRYIITFADRVNWDESWDVLTHPLFSKVVYQNDTEWIMNNEASSKSYMTMERMYEINDMYPSYRIDTLYTPKFDGSCLVISSDLIKSGVNIPHALTHCAEDTSFGEMAKIIMGDQYRQYVVRNILRVHNRRHPKKRMYIKGEDNPRGLAGMNKGAWWDILEKTSKFNLAILRNNQQKFVSLQEVIDNIQKIRDNG